VRWLDTNGMADNRGKRGGEGLPETDKGVGAAEMQWDGFLL
jgi:hypothetical protein